MLTIKQPAGNRFAEMTESNKTELHTLLLLVFFYPTVAILNESFEPTRAATGTAVPPFFNTLNFPDVEGAVNTSRTKPFLVS